MEKTIFELMEKVKHTIKIFGTKRKLDLLKGLKVTLTENVITIKIMANELEKKEEI